MLEKPIPPIKDAEPDDPMELSGVALPGDTRDAMAECFVEEYFMQGFADDMILRLFSNPQFAITHAYFLDRGEEHVKALVARVQQRCGRFRFRVDVAPEGLKPEPELED